MEQKRNPENPKIRVSEETKEKLDGLKLTKGETYEDLINRIIEESVMVRDEYKIFKVKSKVIKIPKEGVLVFEIPGMNASEAKLFLDEIKKRISKDKNTIVIINREIKIPKGTYIEHEREIKGKLRVYIMNIPKEKRNKLFDLKDIKKAFK